MLLLNFDDEAECVEPNDWVYLFITKFGIMKIKGPFATIEEADVADAKAVEKFGNDYFLYRLVVGIDMPFMEWKSHVMESWNTFLDESRQTGGGRMQKTTQCGGCSFDQIKRNYYTFGNMEILEKHRYCNDEMKKFCEERDMEEGQDYSECTWEVIWDFLTKQWPDREYSIGQGIDQEFDFFIKSTPKKLRWCASWVLAFQDWMYGDKREKHIPYGHSIMTIDRWSTTASTSSMEECAQRFQSNYHSPCFWFTRKH